MNRLAKYRMRQFTKHKKYWKPLQKYLTKGKKWYDTCKSFYPDISLFVAKPSIIQIVRIAHALGYTAGAQAMKRHEADYERLFAESKALGFLEPLYLSYFIFHYQFRSEYVKVFFQAVEYELFISRKKTIYLETIYPDWRDHFAQSVSLST